jgi:hypothetical protein
VLDSTNPLFEITVDTYTISGCFSTPGEYVFQSTTSARIGGIQNTSNSTIQFESKINIDGVHDSEAPIYNSGYMYNIAYESNLSYSTNLGGLGQGNTPVTYELVTSQSNSLGGYGASRVPCSDINLTTGAYRINSSFCTGSETIDAAFGGGAKYYALKVRATDSNGQYSTRDVLLYFNTTSNQPPAFTTVPAPGDFTITPGQTANVQFCAQDPDPADTLNFTFSPTRSWITRSAVTVASPATTPDTYCITFTLAPPVGTSEAFNFEVSVYDSNNTFVRSASNIYSFQAGAALPGNTIVTTPTPFVPTGPMITSISPRKINLGITQEVKITGERLNGITKFTVRGLTVKVKSNTEFEIVFDMPPQSLDGFADIYFETPQGNLSWSNALVFLPASTPKSQSSLSFDGNVSGFYPGSPLLTKSLKQKLDAIAQQISWAKTLTCTGFTMGPTTLPVDAKLAKARAVAACDYLKKNLAPNLDLQIDSAQDMRLGSSVRRVEITARN